MWDYGKLLALMSGWDWEKILTVSAAWVQAVGSIIALFVAFRVASGQARREEQRRTQEAADWRAGLFNLGLEARLFVEHSKMMNDRESGAAYAEEYDSDYCQTLIALLYERVKSDHIDVRYIRPLLIIRRELTNVRHTIEQYLPRLKVKQFPWELPNYLAERDRLIAEAFDDLVRRRED